MVRGMGTAAPWPLDKLLAALVSSSPKSRELRQNSPFAGVLREGEGAKVLAAWQAQTQRIGPEPRAARARAASRNPNR